MRNLTRKQVFALARALKRRGYKLPRVGYCTMFGPKVRLDDGRMGTTVGRGHGEVCHDVSTVGGKTKHVYYFVGGFDAHHKMRRREEKFGRRWPPPKGRR